MDIESAEKSFQDVTYGEDSFDNLLNHLSTSSNVQEYHLSLLIGKSDDAKTDALKKIAETTDRDILTVDANEIISKIESETTENLDYTFKNYNPDETILYLKNGSRLCGVYTGYTHSRVKYATPQERYFLNKVQETGGLYIVDIDNPTDADTTIRRAAQSIVTFPLPQSIFKKLIQKLKGVSMHGYQIKTERPEHYGDQTGNF